VTASDSAGALSIDERIIEFTAAVHRTEPWSLGVTSLALARRLDVPETALLVDLARMAEAGTLVCRFGYFAMPGHAVALSAEQREFFEPLLPAEGDEAAAPVSFANVAAAVRSGRVQGASKAFDTLLAIGALVRIGDDCYRGSQLAAMQRAIGAQTCGAVARVVRSLRGHSPRRRRSNAWRRGDLVAHQRCDADDQLESD
jgi:hypothetical protein